LDWKSWLFIDLNDLYSGPTAWRTACHTMRYMVELLNAVGMQQVGVKHTCMHARAQTIN